MMVDVGVPPASDPDGDVDGGGGGAVVTDTDTVAELRAGYDGESASKVAAASEPFSAAVWKAMRLAADGMPATRANTTCLRDLCF